MTKPDATVGVLGDETLSQLGDDDPVSRDGRRIDRGGDERLVHVLGGRLPRRPCRMPRPSSWEVLPSTNVSPASFGRRRRHVLFIHEGRRRSPRRARTVPVSPEVFPRRPRDSAVPWNEDVRRVVWSRSDLHAEFGVRFKQQVDHHGTPWVSPGTGTLYCAGRNGEFLVRAIPSRAGVHQPFRCWAG